MKIAIILGCLLLIFAVIFFVFNKSDEEGDDISPPSKLSVEQKLDQAEELNDTETLQEKMPWLGIISARWKHIMLSDNSDWVPGPTDYMTAGLLTLDSNYLKEIKESYIWYVVPEGHIPESFLTEEMTGYVLYSSQDYIETHRPLFQGKSFAIFIDFDTEIVMFTY